MTSVLDPAPASAALPAYAAPLASEAWARGLLNEVAMLEIWARGSSIMLIMPLPALLLASTADVGLTLFLSEALWFAFTMKVKASAGLVITFHLFGLFCKWWAMMVTSTLSVVNLVHKRKPSSEISVVSQQIFLHIFVPTTGLEASPLQTKSMGAHP